VFSKFVVGTDGSESATKAVHQAAELADKLGAEIHLVTVIPNQDGVGVLLPGVAAPDVSKGSAILRTSVEKMLQDLSAELSSQFPSLKITTHVETGSAAEGLLTTAEAVHADCIVVGNRGMTGARRILGSVPNNVSHNATCNVLIINTQ